MPSARNGVGSAVAIAALAQQVAGIEEDQRNIRDNISTLQSRMESGLHEIANKIESRAQPQWGIYIAGLALVFSMLSALGSLAYWPINTSVNELKAADLRFRDGFVRNDLFVQYDKTIAALLDRHDDATKVNQASIEQLRREIISIAPPSSFLEEVRKRLERLESRLINRETMVPR